MKVLLTGATGFIGSHLARLLVSTNYEVYTLIPEGDDLYRIKDIVSQLHMVDADLLATEKIKNRLQEIRPEICLHLAWYVEPDKYLTAPENINLLTASLHLAAQLAKLGCQRFVGIGTCLEYDIGSDCLYETSPVKPRTLYAASKLALYTVLEQLGNLTGMEVVWPRLFYLYGPFEPDSRLVPSVICSLLHGKAAKVTAGEQVRDYLHVEDVATAIWAVAQSRLSGPVNIGSGKPVTVREVVGDVGKIIGKPELIEYGALPYSPSDPMFVCADNKRLRENTAWAPKYDLERGLRLTVDWWKTCLKLDESRFQ